MSTLIDNLNYIESCKLDIKSAIEEKGVDMTGVSFPGYAAAIGSIPSGGAFDLKYCLERSYFSSEIEDPTVTMVAPYALNGAYRIPAPGRVDILYFDNLPQHISLLNCSIVCDYGMGSNPSLQYVDLPNCKVIGERAFYDCSNMSMVNLPKCEEVMSSAFLFAGIQDIYLPKCEIVRGGVFSACGALTTADLPRCTALLSSAFSNCNNLIEVNIPANNYFYTSTFAGCGNLEKLTVGLYTYKTPTYNNNLFKNATKILNGIASIYVASDTYNIWTTATGWSSFAAQFVSVDQSLPVLSYSDGLVYGLTTVLDTDYLNYLGITTSDVTAISFPNVFKIGSLFSNNSTLITVDLPACEVIGSQAFSGCTSLIEVYLNGSSVCELTYSNAFYGTPIQLGGGSIYVPSSLVDAYKVAKNWRYYSSVIFPISEPTTYLSFSNGLLYGNVSSISDTYIVDYQLPISSMDITAVSLPDCTDIGFGTFLQCSNISEVYIPKVEGIGSSAFRYCSSLQSINLPSCGYIGSYGLAGCDLRIISAPVLTGIENNAIVNNKNLESVYFPELTYLGGYGLYNNPKLSYVSLPSVQQIGSNAFNTTAIIAINLPYVNNISAYAFGSCSKLTTLFLGSEYLVTLGGSTVFNKVGMLSDIFVPESLYNDYLQAQWWSAISIATVLRSMPTGNTGLWFDGYSIVGSLTSIGSDYYNVYSIDSNAVYSVNLPLVLSIESGTFKNHQNLESYYMPYISSYPDELFYNTGITGLTFTESMTLGNSVFKNCASLGWVDIYYANDILSIGSDVFAGCTSLETITVPYVLYSSYLSAENWSEYASLIVPAAELDIKFSDGLVYGSRQYLTSEYLNDLGITADQVLEVSLPECVEVGSSTFKDHINLSKVSLPLCTTVYVQGFSGCTSLEEAYLPAATTLFGQVFFSCYALNSVTLTNCQTMSAGCFRYCSALATLTLPSLTNIAGANVFADCVGMTSLVLPGDNLASLAASTAFNNNTTYIYVPDSMVADYQAAKNWSIVAGRILSIQ